MAELLGGGGEEQWGSLGVIVGNRFLNDLAGDLVLVGDIIVQLLLYDKRDGVLDCRVMDG